MRRERSKGGTEGSGSQLHLLDAQFRRIRRQVSRLKGSVSENTKPWRRWSASVDTGLDLVSRISATPAADIAGVAIKLRAILWAIEISDSLVDAGDLRRVRSLDREARRLARGRIPKAGG